MKDKKDIQYKILKSEACGHTIEYKIVKKEHELEKARIDEGLSPREKMKAREARSSKEREPKELSPEQYETGKKIARTKAVTETGEKQRKQTLKDVLHTHKQNTPKTPSKEDLEYPMAASEEDCKCEDKTEKCECEDKEMKKREKFYIQKIQELRKQQLPLPLQGGSLRDRPIKEIPRVLGSKLKTGAKDLGSRLGERVSNLASKAGNVTPNQIVEGAKGAASRAAEGAKGAASRVGQNAASLASRTGQGALGLAGQVASKAAPLARFAGPAGAAYSALNPSEIGQSAADKNFVQQQMGISDRNIENRQYGGKNAGQYVLQNAPEGSQRNFQEKSNTEMKQALGLPAAQAPAAQAPAAQAPAAQAPVAQAPAAQTPAEVAAKPQSFGEAFKAARSARIGGTGKDTFDFGGKQYHSFTKDDFAQGIGNNYNPELKQQQKSIKSTPATPNTENAPGANPMKGPDLGSTKLRPDENIMPKNQA